MANAQTKHSIKLRRSTRAQHAERVRLEGVRIDVSLLDADGTVIRLYGGVNSFLWAASGRCITVAQGCRLWLL